LEAGEKLSPPTEEKVRRSATALGPGRSHPGPRSDTPRPTEKKFKQVARTAGFAYEPMKDQTCQERDVTAGKAFSTSRDPTSTGHCRLRQGGKGKILDPLWRKKRETAALGRYRFLGEPRPVFFYTDRTIKPQHPTAGTTLLHHSLAPYHSTCMPYQGCSSWECIVGMGLCATWLTSKRNSLRLAPRKINIFQSAQGWPWKLLQRFRRGLPAQESGGAPSGAMFTP
jgi:hypothetical protein